ncbi:WD40 repeat domain-containing protein [Baaleninema simplex]|uniref:WD40 repeat domain-containing protein n=1 Tax=Baaleninema simplex TaxID=2862350 RepID=UPI00034DCF6E|nr:WD40 repeat domain-containing protein [Baaleninema simplex]
MSQSQWNCTNTLSGHEGGVNALVLRRDGRLLVSGSEDTTIKFWDMLTEQKIQSWQIHKQAVTTLALTKDGIFVASGSEDGAVKVTDIPRGKIKHISEPRGRITSIPKKIPVTSVVFSPDDKIVYRGNCEDRVCSWEVQTGDLNFKKLGHVYDPESIGLARMVVSTNSSVLAGIGIRLRILEVWDLGEPKDKRRYCMAMNHETSSLAITPNGEIIFIGDDRGNVHIYNTQIFQKLCILEGHSGVVCSLAVSPDRKVLASGGEDTTIKLWNLETQTEICTLSGHTEAVKALTFNLDGTGLISGSQDTTIKIWGA